MNLAGRLAMVIAGAGVVCVLAGSCDGGGGSVAESAATLRGTVATFQGGNGANVNVSVRNTDLSSTTADDGFFIVSGVPPGKRTVDFERGGSKGSLSVKIPPRSVVNLKNVRVRDGDAEADDVEVEASDDHRGGGAEAEVESKASGSQQESEDHGAEDSVTNGSSRGSSGTDDATDDGTDH